MANTALIAAIVIAIGLGLGLGLGFGLQSPEPEITTPQPEITTLEPTTFEPITPEPYCSQIFDNCQNCSIADKYNNKAEIECTKCFNGFYQLNGCYKQCNQNDYSDWQVTCEEGDNLEDADYECKFLQSDGNCFNFNRIYNSDFGYDDGYSVGTKLNFKYYRPVFVEKTKKLTG